MIFLVLVVIWQYFFSSGKNNWDVIILDGISAPIPLFKLFSVNIPVLFYCHFPDKYLCVERRGLLKRPLRGATLLKRAYRLVFDWIEESSTFCSDMILVNSEFTASMFSQAFVLGKVYKP